MRSGLILAKQLIYSLVLTFLPMGLSANSHSSSSSTPEGELIKAMEQCRHEKAALDRLDCYDSAWGNNPNLPQGKQKGGVAWERAIEQESTRTNNSISLLTKSYNTEEGNPIIIITTPALGHKDPRPVLMFSCIDNITRLQIALISPTDKRDTYVEISTDKNKFETRWFFRENGFLLEASRGLEGISEIQRLFKANTIKIKSNVKDINGLTFNIQNLEYEIKSLRTACHW